MDVGYKNPEQQEKLYRIHQLIDEYKNGPSKNSWEIEKEINAISLDLAKYLKNKYPDSFKFLRIDDRVNKDYPLYLVIEKSHEGPNNYVIYEFMQDLDQHVFFHNGREYNKSEGPPKEFIKFAVDLGLSPEAIKYLYNTREIPYNFNSLISYKL